MRKTRAANSISLGDNLVDVSAKHFVKKVVVLFCLFALFIGSAVASDEDAIVISQNIQARHLMYGTIVDPIFAAPDSDEIVGYTHCGDAAIWTGHYLAAEAFHYKVTGSPEALDN